MKRFFSLLLTSIILLFPYKLFSLQWPTDNHTINCVFGEIHGGNHFHRGIDIRSKYQSVYAIADGKVVEIDTTGGTTYGIYIIIEHGNGKQSLYAHLKPKSYEVKKDDKVKAGQKIATSGMSGTDAPHLHFEMRRVLPTPRHSTVRYFVNPLKNHTTNWFLGSPEDVADPVIKGVYFQEVDNKSKISFKTHTGSISRVSGWVKVELNTYDASRDTIKVKGKVKFIVNTVDAKINSDGSGAGLTVYRTEYKVDGKQKYVVEFDYFKENESQRINQVFHRAAPCNTQNYGNDDFIELYSMNNTYLSFHKLINGQRSNGICISVGSVINNYQFCNHACLWQARNDNRERKDLI